MNAVTDHAQRQMFQQARLSRDARFDGRFFTAVKTTGIFCRSICPANPPKEDNVSYYLSATDAAAAGYRPCLRCRPDSAPQSAAWMGNQAVVQRAMRLIHRGWLQDHDLPALAEHLGITDRYLRQLFQRHLGASPKQFAMYHQCLFAKQLIHQTQLPMSAVALASGFHSVRRFNDCFKKLIQVTPTEIRRQTKQAKSSDINLKLFYRPPYDWLTMQEFLSARFLHGIEHVTNNSYGRSIALDDHCGYFTATHVADQHAFEVSLNWPDLSQLRQVVAGIRRLLDLDAEPEVIKNHLHPQLPTRFKWQEGLRVPGIWSTFEAGIRAILGQQVSITAARKLLQQVVDELGERHGERVYFPTAKTLASHDLNFLRMPGSRRQTINRLASHVLQHPNSQPDDWLQLKGIGPWTVQYIKMRGQNDPDVFLPTDAGVKKALAVMADDFDAQQASPWRSYLTFQMWQQ